VDAVHTGIVVTVRGISVTVKLVICSPRERKELRKRGERRLRDFIAENGLHRAGDGEMFVCFIEQAAGGRARDLDALEPLAIVHEADEGAPVFNWSEEEAGAACREVLEKIAPGIEASAKRNRDRSDQTAPSPVKRA